VRKGRCAAHLHAQQQRHNAQFGGWSWAETRKRIIARDGGCVMPAPHEGALKVDHIVPRSLGGSSEDANLRTLCKAHHDVVTAKQAGERAVRLGRRAQR